MNFLKSIASLLLISLLFVSCKEKSSETLSNAETEAAVPKVKKEIATKYKFVCFTIENIFFIKS